MLFHTASFALFYLTLLALYWGFRWPPVAAKALLLAASLGFYAFWHAPLTLLLVASALWNWGAGLVVAPLEGRARRIATWLGVAGNLGVLATFKYAGLFSDTLNWALFSLGAGAQVDVIDLVLPLAISFYTFQGVSYVVDVARKDIAPTTSPLDFTLYIAFFPQLIAGPIMRAGDMIPQIEALAARRERVVPLGFGLTLILLGLFKKTVLANYLATDLVDEPFFDPLAFGGADLMLAAYGYTLQIYCDFSAYSDMAIGLAALLGFGLVDNFNQPYRAASMREFWRRWHITLSTWLRDYLYIPLGGNRRGAKGLNLFLTMLLGGLWHGAAWKFALWGAAHGGLLAGEDALRRRGWALPRWLAVVIVFHLVVATFVLFRIETIDLLPDYAAGLADWSAAPALFAPMTLVVMAVAFALHWTPKGLAHRAGDALNRLHPVAQGIVAAVILTLILAIGPDEVTAFIYFQF